MAMFVPLPLLLAEFLLFVMLASRIGFFPVVGAYLAPTLIGLLLLSFHSRTAMMALVRKMQQGHRPEGQLLSMAAKFLGALLFLPPLVSPRILGLLLLLPGTRHALVLFAQSWLAKKAAQGGARMYGFGPRGGFRVDVDGFQDFREVREERDADVIEVKALPITPRESNEEDPQK